MPHERNEPKEALDAAVMAGDRDAYKPVHGQNKALLEIEGVPVLAYVISALQQCRYVSRIFVVGPKERILAALDRAGALGTGQKEVIVLEQGTTVLENAWNTFLATLPSQTPGDSPLPDESLRAKYEEKAVLFLGADLPVLTHHELEEFIERCDLDRYDYILGLTPEEALKPFYPRKGIPGIRFDYFHFKESKERQNNLHMIRVFRVVNRQYTQLMYRFRHQRKWHNILLLLWVLLRAPELRIGMILRFCLLHACRLLGRVPWMPFQGLLRRFLDKGRLEEDVGLLLRTRFGSTLTTYGGAALDVDNNEHFAVICRQFHRWRAFQEALHRNRTGPPETPPDDTQTSGLSA